MSRLASANIRPGFARMRGFYAHSLVLTPKLTQLPFDDCPDLVGNFCDPFSLENILRYREMPTVEHHRAETALQTFADHMRVVRMVEMQKYRDAGFCG